MKIIGIDPSLSGTAVCIGNGGERETAIQRTVTKNMGDHPAGRIKRIEKVVSEVERLINGVDANLILIETYAFGSNTVAYSAELGGILRWHLLDHTKHLFEVAPLTLKKFLTGKGKGQKEVIAGAIGAKFGRTFPNNDETDAFGLYQLARAVTFDPETLPRYQAECLATVFGDSLAAVRAACAHNGEDGSNGQEESPAF